ncbi:MAG: DUF4395 family protein [Candidatus Acidiferrales bacterium]|jgi:hypothetical protein
MSSYAVRNFMKQQGFSDEPNAVCDMHFSGLYFQPRIVGTLIVVAIILGSPAFFFALSAVLWWNVLLPKLNPFEVFYNRVFAAPRGKPPLAPAPPARRFAQGMAAAFLAIVGVALTQGWIVTARVFEAFVVMAFSALLFGKFCLGAYIYHLLRGKVTFANSTLPWARHS